MLCALSEQFAGITLKIDACQEDTVDTRAQKAILQMSVLLINSSVAVWPLLRRYLEGTFSADYAKLVKIYNYLYTNVFIRCCRVSKELMCASVSCDLMCDGKNRH